MQVHQKIGSGAQFFALCSLLLITLLVSILTSAQASAQEQLDNIDTYIDGTIEAQMILEDVPAVTVSVVKDGELIFSKGYGLADIEEQEPVNAETSLFSHWLYL